MGYFLEPAKLYYICPKEEKAEARAAFEEAGIEVNFCPGKFVALLAQRRY